MKDVQAFFVCRAIRTKCFDPVGCLVKLAHASFNTRKDLESSFHCCGGPAKLVLASLEGTGKQFSSLGCPMESRMPLLVPGKI